MAAAAAAVNEGLPVDVEEPAVCFDYCDAVGSAAVTLLSVDLQQQKQQQQQPHQQQQQPPHQQQQQQQQQQQFGVSCSLEENQGCALISAMPPAPQSRRFSGLTCSGVSSSDSLLVSLSAGAPVVRFGLP
jgi:hypothetical protein